MRTTLRSRPKPLTSWRAALCAALALVVPVVHADPIPLGLPRRWRIVPIGDSITQGQPSHLTYRYPLWKMLIDAGVDFVRVKNSTRLAYRIGVASEPGAWDWTPTATETVSATSTGNWTEQVRIRDLTNGPARFLKLEIALDDTP